MKSSTNSYEIFWRGGIYLTSNNPFDFGAAPDSDPYPGIFNGLAPSEPEFNSRWYPYEPLMAAGREFAQNCPRAPVRVLTVLVGMSEPFKGVDDDKFGRCCLAARGLFGRRGQRCVVPPLQPPTPILCTE